MSDILLIHGAWTTADSWERFAAQAHRRSLTTSSIPWPHLDGRAARLREAPPPRLAGIGIGELVEHYAKVVRAQPEPPVLVGHSLGGTVAQLLLDRGLGRAAVAVCSPAVRGVLPRPGELRSVAPVLAHLRPGRSLHTLSRRAFRTRFANGLPADQVDAAYDATVVPAPSRFVVQLASAPLSSLTRVRPTAGSAPLLLVAAAEDRMVSPSSVEAVARLYRKAGAPVDLMVFPDRSHWLLNEPGGQAAGEAVLDWVQQHLRPSTEGLR